MAQVPALFLSQDLYQQSSAKRGYPNKTRNLAYTHTGLTFSWLTPKTSCYVYCWLCCRWSDVQRLSAWKQRRACDYSSIFPSLYCPANHYLELPCSASASEKHRTICQIFCHCASRRKNTTFGCIPWTIRKQKRRCYSN